MAQSKKKPKGKGKGTVMVPNVTIVEKPEETNTAVIISSLEKQAASPIRKLKKVDKVKTQDDFDAMAENLKVLKDIGKLAKEEEGKLTVDIYDSINKLESAAGKIEAFFLPFQNKIKELEKTAKEKMAQFLLKASSKQKQVEKDFNDGKIKKISTFVTKTADAGFKKGGAAKVRKVWQLFVNEPDKVPRQFCVPDEEALKQHFKKNPVAKVAGCEWKQVDQIAI